MELFIWIPVERGEFYIMETISWHDRWPKESAVIESSVCEFIAFYPFKSRNSSLGCACGSSTVCLPVWQSQGQSRIGECHLSGTRPRCSTVSATHIPQQSYPCSSCFRGGKCSLAADAHTLWKWCSESPLQCLPTTKMPPEMRGRFF